MSSALIDAQARQQAVDAQRSYIVQAPAGSGKTELLTDRILSLLLTVERPEDILSITFTRKAAAEMRDRVIRKLDQAYLPEPQEDYLKQSWQRAQKVVQRDQALKWHLLDNPNRLRIQTIDSFCQSLVYLMPTLSGSGGGLTPTEASNGLMEKAAQRVVDQVDSKDCVAYVIEHLDVNVETFKSLLVSMLHRRDSWLPFIDNPREALALMVHTLNNLITDYLREAKRSLPSDWLSQTRGIIVEAATVLHEKDKVNNFLAPWLAWDGEDIAPTIDNIALWRSFAFFVTTNKGGIRKTIDCKIGVEKGSRLKPAFIDWLKNTLPTIHGLDEKINIIKTLPTQLFGRESGLVMKTFFECLQVAEKALQTVFREEGRVDFLEVSQRALSALGSQEEPTELLLKIDTHLQHILIDEFQDTSFSQKRLLEAIVSGWESGDGRTLFLVGDPMQSIYGFRQAEVGLFLDIAHAAAENQFLALEDKKPVIGNVVIDLLLLQENFRSDGGVVQWVNRTFNTIFPEKDDATLGAIRYRPSHAFKQEKASPAVQYYPFVQKESNHSPDAERVKNASQEHVVNLVKQALERQHGKAHPVAILVSSRHHIDTIFNKLQAENIPVNAIEMAPLGKTEEVMDMMQLVRALSHTGDRLAWMALLRSPFCGLRLKTLTLLFEDQPDASVPFVIQKKINNIDELAHRIGQEESKRLAFFASVVLGRGYGEDDLSFTRHIEKCWEELGGNELYSSEGQKENIQALLAVVDDIAPYGHLDTTVFEQRVDALYANPSTQTNSVEIMTMHKAKGLEFKEVILYGLHRSKPSRKAALLEIESERGKLLLGTIAHKGNKTSDPTSNLISWRNGLREQQELKRLLYVACTRAEEKIHLVYVQEKNTKAKSMLAELEGNIDQRLVVDCGYTSTAADQTPLVNDGKGNAYCEHTENDRQWAFDNSRLKRYSISTIEGLFVKVSKGLPKAASYSLVGKAWRFNNRQHTAVGIVTHAWLERMGADKLHGWSPVSIQEAGMTIARQLRQAGVSQENRQAATARVQFLLTAVLNDERGRWLLSYPHAMREWSLFNEQGQEKIVDLALETEEGWWVVDYKTNQRNPDESIEAFRERLRLDYTDQLKSYAEYIRAFDGRPVNMALYAVDGCQWIEL